MEHYVKRPKSNHDATQNSLPLTTSGATNLMSSNPFPRIKVHVGGLHCCMTQANFEQLMRPYGRIVNIQFMKGTGYALCEYASSQQATAAITCLNGRLLLGRSLTVAMQLPRMTTSATTEWHAQALLHQYGGGVLHDAQNRKRSLTQDCQGIATRTEAIRHKLNEGTMTAASWTTDVKLQGCEV